MISVLGRPLIDYVLEALRGCREVSQILVSVTGRTPLTDSHVNSRGYRSINCPGVGYEIDFRCAVQLLSTPYVMRVAANLPLLRSESIDNVVAAFYRSKRSSMVVGVPIDDIQEIINEPATIMDMDGVKAAQCGVSITECSKALSGSHADEAYLVTDLEDFAVDVNNVGQLRQAERILRSRHRHERSSNG